MPPTSLSASIRAEVSMPRSPTSTTSARPNRFCSFSTWVATVLGSARLPSKTSTATEQPELDLRQTPLSVSAVPALGQLALAAFQVDRGQIVEGQAALAQVSLGQPGLDLGLSPQEPVHGRVELVFVGVLHT